MTDEPSETKKRVFISDMELKAMLASGGHLPGNAIVSPLSRDWLDYAGTDGAAQADPRRSGVVAEPELRERITDVGRRLYALGFVPASDGNISARLADGSLLITPSGASKGGLEPGDIAKLDLEGRLISGRKPSSEYRMHLFIYKERPDVAAIVHAHPPVATGLASAGIALDKPLTSEIVITLGSVPLAAYATPGTVEVTDVLAGLVKNHNAVMLSNHGVVAYGPCLESAFRRMETVEQAAKITLVAEQLGGGRLIPPEKVRLLEEIRRRVGM